MIKKLVDKLKQRVPHPSSLDLNGFNDPLATRISWRPLKHGGTNFGTHKLVQDTLDRLTFRATLGARFFYGLFLVVGLGILVLLVLSVGSTVAGQSPFPKIMLSVMGLVFVSIGGAMMKIGTQPIVFDTSSGFFWKGRIEPNQVFDHSSIKVCVKLSRIHAVQVISEYCRGNKSSFTSYELNLVLDDGERINVVDHGNRQKLVDSAKKIAAFLGTPLWNAIESR